MTSNPDVPPFIGYVETTVNALRLIHAARQGVIPRITRRLNDTERRTMIKSGAVFVFSVEESGIKRWTDGLLWSPSRIVGNFLVYREINERTSSRGSHRKSYPVEDAPRATRKSSPEQISGGFKSQSPPGHGSVDQGTFKTGGLIKKTITVTIDGSDLHLISYYTSEDIRSGHLKRPSSRPDIMGLYMPPHIFRLTNFRVPPKVEIGPDGKPRLVCEVEDMEPTECKTEEQNYVVGASTTWTTQNNGQTSPSETSFSSSSLYPISSQSVSGQSIGYGNRDRSTDRWPNALDTLRISPMNRDGLTWQSQNPPTAHHTPQQSISRRRDSAMPSLSDSWNAQGHQQSGRWPTSATYDQSGNMFLDRNRGRSGNSYENTVGIDGRRDGTDGMVQGYGGRYLGHVGSRELGSHRLSWLTREGSDHDKEGRSSHTGASFPPPSGLQFNSQGYTPVSQSYGSSWNTASENALMDPPSLQAISPTQGSLPPYETSYSSGSLPSPEDFSHANEYTDT